MTVYRLFDAADPEEMAAIIRVLLADERSTATTEVALDNARHLFLTPASPGVQLAVQALRELIPAASVTAVVTGYVGSVLDLLGR